MLASATPGRLAALTDAAGDQYSEQIHDVKAAADAVGSALRSASENPSGQALAAAGDSLQAFGLTAGALGDQVAAGC